MGELPDPGDSSSFKFVTRGVIPTTSPSAQAAPFTKHLLGPVVVFLPLLMFLQQGAGASTCKAARIMQQLFFGCYHEMQ
jgi:hypothetical protein